MPKSTSDMLAELEATSAHPIAAYEARNPELAAELWDFFMAAKDRRLDMEAAFDAWEANRGPLPCSRSHLRNVINARHRSRK